MHGFENGKLVYPRFLLIATGSRLVEDPGGQNQKMCKRRDRTGPGGSDPPLLAPLRGPLAQSRASESAGYSETGATTNLNSIFNSPGFNPSLPQSLGAAFLCSVIRSPGADAQHS